MRSISLATYLFRITPDRDDRNIIIDALPDGGSIHKVLEQWLRQCTIMERNTRTGACLKLAGEPLVTDNHVAATMELGRSGESGTLYDGEGEHKADIEPVDATTRPFYVGFRTGPNVDYFLGAFQATGSESYATALINSLKGYIDVRSNGDLVLHAERMVPREITERMLVNGEIKAIEVREYDVKRDPSDVTVAQSLSNLPYRMRKILQPPRGASFPFMDWMRRIVSSKRPADTIGEIEPNADEIVVRVKWMGHDSNVYLSEPNRFYGRIHINEDIVEGPGGLPTFESVHERAVFHMDQIRAELQLADE